MRARWPALACGLALAGASAPAQAQHKFALQLLHFNVQYVCGGTIGFTATAHPELDLDNDAIEDRIIEEGLAPIVELFAAHPDWGVDLEMQGYMLELIAARHPELLAELRALAQSGQIDVVSFHYSDQLFLGYPAEDWERSQALAAQTFADLDVPLSRSVFCQEGQASPTMGTRMAERGYRNMVWPKNLWMFQHGELEAQPLYQFGDVLMVAGGKDVSYDDGRGTTIDVTWTFLNDGELLATGDFDPYFPEFFFKDQAAVDEYEAKLEALEAQGYRIATVDQYVETVKDVVTPAPAPPLLDGTWQPDSTNGIKRWLGGQGAWIGQERDNHVRTLGAQAHRELVAAEAIAKAASLDVRSELDAAWRMLFLGQVTDGTGINPFRGEVQYAIAHMAEALRIARDVIGRSKEALALGAVSIEPASGTVAAARGEPFRGVASAAPLALGIEGGDRAVTESWEQVTTGHHRVTLDFAPGEFRNIAVTFPSTLDDEVAVSLALDDESASTWKRSDFVFESFHFALPTGLVGLGDGRFVIKDQGLVHVAAEVWREQTGVRFADDTAPPEDVVRWVFHVLDGTAADAAVLARKINGQRELER